MSWVRSVRAAHSAQLALLCAYLLLLLVPVRLVPDGMRDNLIGNAALVVPTLIVFARGVCCRSDRAWSWLFAAGMAAFTAGNLGYVNFVGHLAGRDPGRAGQPPARPARRAAGRRTGGHTGRQPARRPAGATPCPARLPALTGRPPTRAA